MKPRDEVRKELVRQWLEKANLDSAAVTRLMDDPDPLRAIVAFHSQQAVEKYLKAFLVQPGIEFPKTHVIRELLDLAAGADPDLAQRLDGAAALTPYGVDVRYPGDFPDVLPGQERECARLALAAREAVLDRLSGR